MKQLLLSIVLYAWETDLNKIFLRNSKTTIWQLASVRYETVMNNIFLSGPPPVCALRTDFMNAFETGDQRKVNWTKSVTTGLNTWNHPNKYKPHNKFRNILLCCA
jgi:hypothetical protein